MAWKKGDTFWCDACECELTLTEVPSLGAAELLPSCCCCGQVMHRR
jgi:hypothetical protein